MFPQATDEVRENNEKLSHCSIRRISKILNLKKDECFEGEEEEDLRTWFCRCGSNVYTDHLSLS